MKKTTLTLLLLLTILVTASAQKQLVIIHTNDTHSRIEPLPAGDRHAPDKGGVERRINYIEQMRAEHENLLLFDAGDFLQGTPYFNLFKGEAEVKAMNLMGYDAVTLGNHEFDYGLEVLEEVVKAAHFPIVSSNYDFSKTPLAGKIKPYLILKRGGVKIGVMGINIQPKGLVSSANYEGMEYLDPVTTSNMLAYRLRTQYGCDLVVALSHLGYQHDTRLAEASRNIDIIIGGHSHTYMEEPDVRKNMDNREVLIYQTAGRGVYVGRINVTMEKIKK
ncbi:metallophosphoesterase [Dysgonomonadaceae bacterium zrk40]|nr:metallophosphoesterase [Dysgonomonadaceae bacterium zrk40]